MKLTSENRVLYLAEKFPDLNIFDKHRLTTRNFVNTDEVHKYRWIYVP